MLFFVFFYLLFWGVEGGYLYRSRQARGHHKVRLELDPVAVLILAVC